MEKKLTRLNLSGRALELKAAHESNRSIARILSRETGESITRRIVDRHFHDIPRDLQKAINADPELKLRAESLQIDIIAGFTYIKAEAEDLLKRAKSENKLETALHAVRELREQLALGAKLLGMINEDPSVTIQQNNNTVEVSAETAKAVGDLLAMDGSKKMVAKMLGEGSTEQEAEFTQV